MPRPQFIQAIAIHLARRRMFQIFISTVVAALALFSWRGFSSTGDESDQTIQPNIIIILADDLGYADLGVQGARDIKTPNIDRMAAEGMRFTRFLSADARCSASRAALLTGRYPKRVGILGALPAGSSDGIDSDEVLVPELLKPVGYATAIIGKWHLGDRPEFLPTQHGFEYFFGLPYSHSITPFDGFRKRDVPPLPLYKNEKVVAENPDPNQLTVSCTEQAVRFIENHHTRPFFLYLSHAMPHVPLGVSARFKGKSRRGLYGDVVMEIDWSVGQVLEALKRNGLDEKTMVVFTSDNGPWLIYGNHAGSAKPLREGKGTIWEGGHRVPFIARWPGKIQAGQVCNELVTMMDILPTVASLSGSQVLLDRKIDGHDIRPLLFGENGARTPYGGFFYYEKGELRAVQSGNWKLVFPHKYRVVDVVGNNGESGKYVKKKTKIALFDLQTDVRERINLAKQFPEVVERLKNLAESVRDDMGDALMDPVESGIRQSGEAL